MMTGNGRAERDRLVLEHSYLVTSEVARYRTWRLERADLHQAGLLGLLVAAARFDPDRAVPFPGYAHTWVRKEIQRAIAQQEFPAVLPAELVGRTVALRRALDEHADRLALAAAALGLSQATVQALHRQIDAPALADEDELPAPGYALTDPEHTVVTADFATAARAALARMPARRAHALVSRYGLDGGPERSYREIGRTLGVSGHTARALVERAQTELRRLLD
jgi:RNA polymerase sigma factor (sigma-70 family)